MKAVAVAAAAAMLALAACDREARSFSEPPQLAATPPAKRQVDVQAGGRTAAEPDAGRAISNAAMKTRPDAGPYDTNAYAVAQGKRLFVWYNCNGCHAHGGGGMGPALMDDQWIYGHQPAAIFTSIVEGRPNGMPSFRDRIPEQQVWQLVAYVRSMSGLLRHDVLPGRSDTLQAVEPELRRDELEPKPAPAAPPSKTP